MFWNAKNGCVKIEETEMYYASFGKGSKVFLVLPGLSDGLTTVKGKALFLAKPFAKFLEEYTVYMFSRKNDMPEGYSIREMAADQATALKKLGITKVTVLGVSQGGMIAQYMAIDFPELVEKLVITVSAPRVNEMIQDNVSAWMKMAQEGDHRSLMIDTTEKGYSEQYLKKYRKVYPMIGNIGKPRTYDRFFRNAEAILGFDAYEELHKIECPTYIIGGETDKTVGVKASYELKENIKNSELHIYPGLGHAAYEEAKDFYDRVNEFLR
ncbi:MAG: alpha/beta hydrolase [Lachnospiraceae bacterium]|nr:alpha/beta hydrolase [Lachnospiraceae bacterium]